MCECVLAIEIQTIGPISMKFGTVEDHDPGMFFVLSILDIFVPENKYFINVIVMIN